MDDMQIDSPNHEQISARAYEIFKREGENPGRDMDNWLRAEQELRQERGSRGTQSNRERSRSSGAPSQTRDFRQETGGSKGGKKGLAEPVTAEAAMAEAGGSKKGRSNARSSSPRAVGA